MHIYKIWQFYGIALPFYVKSDSLVRNFSTYTNQSIKLPALVKLVAALGLFVWLP